MHVVAPPGFDQIHTTVIIKRKKEKQNRERNDRNREIRDRHVKEDHICWTSHVFLGQNEDDENGRDNDNDNQRQINFPVAKIGPFRGPHLLQIPSDRIVETSRQARVVNLRLTGHVPAPNLIVNRNVDRASHNYSNLLKSLQ